MTNENVFSNRVVNYHYEKGQNRKSSSVLFGRSRKIPLACRLECCVPVAHNSDRSDS